eukprot:1163520-Prorocentrum_minimum.AAC.1
MASQAAAAAAHPPPSGPPLALLTRVRRYTLVGATTPAMVASCSALAHAPHSPAASHAWHSAPSVYASGASPARRISSNTSSARASMPCKVGGQGGCQQPEGGVSRVSAA